MPDKFIYSTLANDNQYVVWAEGGNDMPRVERPILIKGGAGVADKRIVTPRGVVTKVTVDDLKLLEGNEVFQRHVKNGFITVDDKFEDPEKVAADMEGRDPGAPLVPQDFADDDKAKPVQGQGNKGKR